MLDQEKKSSVAYRKIHWRKLMTVYLIHKTS